MLHSNTWFSQLYNFAEEFFFLEYLSLHTMWKMVILKLCVKETHAARRPRQYTSPKELGAPDLTSAVPLDTEEQEHVSPCIYHTYD